MKYNLFFPLSLLVCSYANADISSFFLDIEQMDRYGKDYRISKLDEICQSKEEHNLVVIKAVNNKGDLNNKYLDQIQPYYKCFNKVFFSVDSKKWERKSSNWEDTKYYNGIMNKKFAQDNIDYALQNAKKIINKYPNMKFNWYIHYEANLNFFKSDKIKESYKFYLKNLSDSLYILKPADILWSPAFWTPYSKLKNNEKLKLTQNLNDLFKNTPRITWLHFQDFLGQTTYTNCENNSCQIKTTSNQSFKNPEEACLNTKENYLLLRNATKNTNIKNLKVNMELFTSIKSKSNSYIPTESELITERESCYSENNIPIGISFELLYMNPKN
ncbi:hypothetical protein [Acinetobacter proteolyticus]|uniref:hypothetical protein n=1 Tax=Acinetobacter proteolyticus TaxID=1776741 RepID=UPI003D95C792